MLLDEQREILFRGKTKVFGKWVYGDAIVNNLYPSGYNIDEYSIYPKTLGQYTGFKDCNGVKIFEHDIVEYSMTDYSEKVIGDVAITPHGYLIKINNRLDCCPDVSLTYILNHPKTKYFRVIGNVFDNFELLNRRDEQFTVIGDL